ncbi:zinc finger protein Xfin isoform X2 [Dunckerocampus dactyliophorus]|uniref:zinc finger protein Xfin isoform X2 n=1 Tax=Dunckerocampus dactyliophorus TaxID=161453 RepID=UPI002405A620|nr:zinc finger protein Xfin isoform X2 [Dunckerocampus dactyliophorus]
MDEATAEVMKDVPAEEQSIALDVTSSNNSTTPVEGTADGLFCCQDCGETFREEAGYLEHRHQHPDGSCLMYLEPVEDLDDADKVGESTNYCHLCSQSFVNLSEFHSHMENHHSQPSSTQQISGVTKQHTFECAECGKSYSMLGHYLNHQRTHIQASKSLFKDLEHLKKKSFQCESCGRSYSRQSALDAHRRCHEEKLIKPRNRTSEELIPTAETVVEAKPVEKQTRAAPEKLVNCPCGKSFSSLQGLKTHQRFSHSSQCCTVEAKAKQRKNVFYCKECRKMFHGHLAWFNHEKWHENRSEGSANRFPCEVCGKVFMTQTFYYRHHRMAHSDEAPAKSFLNQVGQLQKRAFECNDCGLKFSRPSAFHAHQLQHTNAFKETEGLTQMHVPVRQQMTLEGEQKETKILRYQADAENVLRLKGEEDPDANEEDTESYEPGDFNVLVISASESEDETVQDSHVEQGCESDQEARGFAETVEPPNPLVSKPELGLNIVQVDLESGKEQRPPAATEAEDKVPAKRLDCPDCYRWFTSEASLRAHLVWHSIHERRRKKAYKRKYAQRYLGPKSTAVEVLRTGGGEVKDVEDQEMESACQAQHESGTGNGCDEVGSSPTEGSTSMKAVHKCHICGKAYSYLLSFRKHMQLHKKRSSLAKSLHGDTARTYDCPICGMGFYRKTRLQGHMITHRSREVHRCDQCNKSFASFSLWIVHEQLHKTKPFWCLSCAKGFKQEDMLDKHLQRDHLGNYKCNVCPKRFLTSSQLSEHLSSHASISRPVSSLHFKMADGDENKMENGNLSIPNEEPEPHTDKGTEEHFDKARGLCEDEEFAHSEESDCGEPLHKPPALSTSPACHPADKETAGVGEAQTGLVLDGSDKLEQNQHRAHHKYWEWECFECDMGFDDVSQLHVHYIKHATGEVPFIQDGMEG